jgi:hypothetical protein
MVVNQLAHIIQIIAVGQISNLPYPRHIHFSLYRHGLNVQNTKAQWNRLELKATNRSLRPALHCTKTMRKNLDMISGFSGLTY